MLKWCFCSRLSRNMSKPQQSRGSFPSGYYVLDIKCYCCQSELVWKPPELAQILNHFTLTAKAGVCLFTPAANRIKAHVKDRRGLAEAEIVAVQCSNKCVQVVESGVRVNAWPQCCTHILSQQLNCFRVIILMFCRKLWSIVHHLFIIWDNWLQNHFSHSLTWQNDKQ